MVSAIWYSPLPRRTCFLPHQVTIRQGVQAGIMTTADGTTQELTALISEAVSAETITETTGRLLSKWVTEPQFGEYRDAIALKIRSGDWEELEACFWEEIPFGTGGVRFGDD